MERPSASVAATLPRGGFAPVFVPALADVSGTVRLEIGGERVGALFVTHGSVMLTAQNPEYAAACLSVASLDDLLRIMRGEVNAVVAAIQGRLAFAGDVELGVKVVLALNAAKAFGASASTPAPASAQEEHHAS